MPKADDPKTTTRWPQDEYDALQAASAQTGAAVGSLIRACVTRALPDVIRSAKGGRLDLRSAPTTTEATGVYKEATEYGVANDVEAKAVLASPTARDILKARSEALRNRQP